MTFELRENGNMVAWAELTTEHNTIVVRSGVDIGVYSRMLLDENRKWNRTQIRWDFTMWQKFPERFFSMMELSDLRELPFRDQYLEVQEWVRCHSQATARRHGLELIED